MSTSKRACRRLNAGLGVLTLIATTILYKPLTEASDLPTAPALSAGVLDPVRTESASAPLQIFEADSFSLSEQQLTLALLPSGEYKACTEALADFVDLGNSDDMPDGSADYATVFIETGFPFGGVDFDVLYVHKDGYIFFNESKILAPGDCLKEAALIGSDRIVAFCTAYYSSRSGIVGYLQLDDRLIVQWGLDWQSCTSSSSGSTPQLVAVQAELFYDGSITLGWTNATPCSATVGIVIADSPIAITDFSGLDCAPEPKAPDCRTFSVNGPGQAYSCSTRKVATVPKMLPPAVLFAGGILEVQQVLTVVNAAGQRVDGGNGWKLSQAPSYSLSEGELVHSPHTAPAGEGAPAFHHFVPAAVLPEAAPQEAPASNSLPPSAPPTVAVRAPPPPPKALDLVTPVTGIKKTPAESEAEFVPAPGCTEPKQAGPCTVTSMRWYFDNKANDCKEFLFGGCLGNLNNFVDNITCLQACVGGVSTPDSVNSTNAIVAVPSQDELVFLAQAINTTSFVTLDITSGVLPAGASAALHLTYNALGLTPGHYNQSLLINTNDNSQPRVAVTAELVLFCDRFNDSKTQPAAPNATFVTLNGTAPSWAAGTSLPNNKFLVYFEIDVIFQDPVLTLLPDNIVIGTDEGSGVVISIIEITSAAYGPQCSAWTVRGAAPLPPDYATNTQGTLLAASIAGISTIYGDAVPEISFNKTLYNTLPQCKFYALGMTFGGDFGLAVASNASQARAVLMCSAPLTGLCRSCIETQHNSTESSDFPEVTFLGLAPGEDARYDIKVTWVPGELYGTVNLTVGCNATDSKGQPLAIVTPLSFAVVREPALNPPLYIAIPAANPHYPPGYHTQATTPDYGLVIVSEAPQPASMNNLP